MNCPVCSTQVMPGAAFCDNCGSPLQNAAPVYGQPPITSGDGCPTCNEPITPGEAFCGNCGTSLASAAPLPPTQVGVAPPVFVPPTYTDASSACTSCQSPLQPGSQFCDNCGAAVGASQPQTPSGYPPSQPVYVPSQPVYVPPQQKTHTPYPPQQDYTPSVVPQQDYTPNVVPRLVVQASNTSLNIPAGKSEILIGREDPVSNHFPDIDLTAHGGDEGGVGRSHARLYIQGNQVTIEDNQSVNGTYVNRQRIRTGNRQPLNDGDELRFGRVVIIYQTG